MTDPDVPWAVLLAAGDQPPRAEWARLIAELRSAAAELAGRKPHKMLPPGMVPILRALIAVNDYLHASAAAQADPRLLDALLQLIAAIYEMSNGRTPALFQPAQHGYNRPDKSAATAGT